MTAASSTADSKRSRRQENLEDKEELEEPELKELKTQDIEEDIAQKESELVIFFLSPVVQIPLFI